MNSPNPWTPHHPSLQNSWLSWLEPELLNALEHGPQALAPLLDCVHPGVYTLPVLRAEACQMLLDDLDHLEDWAQQHDQPIQRPNSMNMHGVILDQFGYSPALAELIAKVFKPLCADLYPEVGGATLDHHHGFVVDYSFETDIDLGFHVDDAEVTVNLCLSDDFVGGDLFMRGRRCFHHIQTAPNADELFDYIHTPGMAIIHAGMHRHGAFPIEGGHRRNLILWCRSHTYRQTQPHSAPCPAWCGAHTEHP